MKNLYAFLSVFLLAFATVAQDISIPLFDDETPNLGRNAKPLDNIVLTPPPLPAVSIGLEEAEAPAPDNTSEPAAAKARPAPAPAPIERPNIEIDPPRTDPISLAKNTPASNTDDIIARLQREVAEAKGLSSIDMPNQTAPIVPPAEGQAKLDIVVNPVEQTPDNKAAPKSVTPVATAPKTPSVQTPTSLEGLFGKTHNVRGFELAGLSLGMTPDEVIQTASEEGYIITKVQKALPLFRTSYYEHKCRNAKVYRPEILRDCIMSQAKADEVEYISSLTFAKKPTKEYIQVLFSSNATDNVAFKIYYENEGDNSLTMTQKNLAKQLRRKEAFWRMLFETYGLPDDSEQIIWGDPQKTYMQATMHGSAYNAYIVMEDKEIQDDDYFAAEDDAKELTYKASFSFAETEDGE